MSSPTHREPARSHLQRISSPLFILPLFATLGLIGILHHSMWRDEMNTWLIVRDSQSLGEMLGYVNYQGHPALWALLVSLVQTVSDAPVAMQLLHWGLGVGAIALFWSYSPFTRVQKVLFTFGYLPFYEYFLISRPYVLGMLCIFLFCALYPSRHRTYIGVAIALGLMANSHAFAAIISLAATASLGLEFLLEPERRRAYFKQAKSYDGLVSVVILIALYAFAFAILTPPIDSANVGGRDGWNLFFDLQQLLKVLGRLLGAYTLIIPNSRRWLDLIVCDLIGVSMLLVFGWHLLRNRTAFLVYSLSTLGLLSFFYLRFIGHGTRHYGFLWLALIAGLWLAGGSRAVPSQLELESSARRVTVLGRSPSLDRLAQQLFLVVLLFHLSGGLYRFVGHFQTPFSAAQATADYIQTSPYRDGLIVASPDTNMAALAGYLDRQLYYPELEGLGSFTIFQEGRRQRVNQRQILRQARSLLTSTHTCQLLLVLVEPLTESINRLAITPLETFDQSWHRSERMYTYDVVLRQQNQCEPVPTDSSSEQHI